MYNPQLETFIEVAKAGSFTKAANSLYLSPTAVMKQINSLEGHLKVKLIERTSSGVKLTPAGQEIFKDAEFLIDYSKKSTTRAREIETTRNSTFSVGTSLLNPAKPFMDLWYTVNAEFPDFKLHLVPFEDNHEGIMNEIRSIGEKFDFLVGVCDSAGWLDIANFLQLGNYAKMIAVSRDHPLAKKDWLEIEDLYGQTLMMIAEGDSPVNDYLRNDIKTNHPEIKIEDTPIHYDMSVFNECAETEKCLLSIECWQDVHPGLKTIPVNWDYEIPYGLIYAKEPSENVERFINVTKRTIEASNKIFESLLIQGEQWPEGHPRGHALPKKTLEALSQNAHNSSFDDILDDVNQASQLLQQVSSRKPR